MSISSPGGRDWRPTVQSVVETHEPFFNLMVSYALPHTSSSIRQVLQPAFDAKVAKNQVPVLKGLVKIKSPLSNWDQPMREQEYLEVEFALGIAKALAILEALVGEISPDGDKYVIVVRGSVELSRLQKKFSLVLRKRFPKFRIPFGGDTELLFNEKKARKFGFS